MIVDFDRLTHREAYQWMTKTILPRPNAWVSTISPEGRTNLAPFSFFQGVTSNPPTLMLVPVNNRDGQMKDTVRNIELVPEFVVNLVTYALAQAMNQTSAALPYGESEIEAFDIPTEPSVRVRPPRVASSPVSFECTLHQIVRIGEGPLAANVIFGRILLAHVSREVLNREDQPDGGRLDLIGRMGREDYATTRDTFTLPRPAGR